MASNYPGTIQTFTNPAGTNTLDSPSHADQHIVENDTLLNIQNTLGTTAGSALFTAFTLSDKPEKKGVITVGTTAYVTSGSLTSNQFLQYNGTNIVGGTAAAGGSSPLTTKGDLYTYGTADTRLPVGTTDGMVLMAASGSATGLAWATASAASIIRNEIPSGSINGTNTVFTLVATPLTNSLNLFQNGVLLLDGTADYSLSANTITFIGTPVTGDKLKADYIINSGYFAVGAASFVKETPSGTPNGTLTAFTLTGTPVTNSEFIYQDGQLLTGGSADYSMANGTINFIDPPLVNSVLTASYQANASVAGNADMVDGLHAADLTGLGWVINETPSGTVNGSNAAFDTASTYVSGSIQVYRDGQLMAGAGADYTETDSNTITFTTAPVTGSVLRVTYQHATSGTMNADTLDGYHANATPTANNIPVLDANALLPVAAIPGQALVNITQTNLASTFNASAGTAEQEVTGLKVTLPVIAATCTVKITTKIYWVTVAGDNNLRVRTGTSGTLGSNTERDNCYVSGAKTSESFTSIVVVSLNLTTQTYVNISVQNGTDANNMYISSTSARSTIVTEVYQ